MKTYVCILALVAIVAAEPPRYRFARYRLQRQESAAEEGEKEATTPRHNEAPYPAAGYRPSKEFKLPTERQQVVPPSTSYGVPQDSYGVPFRTYSTPESEYGVPSITEVETPEHNEQESKEEFEIKGSEKKTEHKENLEEQPNDSEVVSVQGAYYVLLPGSQLQRVQFQTENDISNMAYTARLQYRNEDRAPLYVYTQQLPQIPQYESAAYIQLVK